MAGQGDGIVGAVRGELGRTARRVRNGVRWLTGPDLTPAHPTPSDVVWRDGKAQLRHYHRDEPPRYRQPVVAFLGLVGKSTVFDLYDGGSIVQMLMAEGFDVYVLDWGVADAIDAGNTLETYLQRYMADALATACARSDAEGVTALAYCMGGAMAVQGLAGGADLPIRNLVTLATPFDFHEMDPFVEAIREGRVDIDDLVDRSGNVPGDLVVSSFKRRKPTSDVVNLVTLVQHLDDEEYLRGYEAIGRFLGDYGPVAGAATRQLVEDWIRGNGFVRDTLRLGGRDAPLSTVTCDVLAVIAEKDDITPYASADAVDEVLVAADVDKLVVDAGHVSLFAGRRAVGRVMPEVFAWIAAHSDEVAP